MNRTRNSKATTISVELVWLRQEQKDYNEKQVRVEMEAFRREIKTIIPCFCIPEIYYERIEGEEDELAEE